MACVHMHLEDSLDRWEECHWHLRQMEATYHVRQSSSALDEFAPRLSTWLTAEAGKSRKQRRTLKQMFLDLKELGYEGSYDRVAGFGRQWKVGQQERLNSERKSTPGLKRAVI